MSHFSNDGNAATHDQLMECCDCNNKVTCSDERTEFKVYLCDECYDRRVEELKSQEGD